MSDLNVRQERFVAEYLRDGSATAAAVRAGYAPKSAGTVGPRLAREPSIRAELERRQAAIAHEAAIDTKALLGKAARAYEVAEKVDNAAGMNGAVMIMARLLGLIIDRPDPAAAREAAELAKSIELSRAATLWGNAAESLGLARDAAPDQVVGAVSRVAVWPPEVFRIARAAAVQAERERTSEPENATAGVEA